MYLKEKATEIVEKYVDVQIELEETTQFYWGFAAQCALIAIKNEYQSNRELLFNLKSSGVIESEKVYLSRLQGLIDEEIELIVELAKL